MDNENTRKLARQEKKRKKLTALVDIIRLNDNDKKMENKIINTDEQPVCKRIKLNSSNSDSNDSECSQAKQTSLQLFDSSIDHYKSLKKEIADRQRLIKTIPRLRLKMQGELASMKLSPSERVPLFLTDIQYLLSNTLMGNTVVGLSPARWCSLERSSRISHTIVMIVEGVSLYNFTSNQSLFKESSKYFEDSLEIMLPPVADKIVEALIAIPLTDTQLEFVINYYGSMDSALHTSNNPIWMSKSIFPIKEINHPVSEEEKRELPKTDVFPRTHLLLSPLQMVDSCYPLPLTGVLSVKYKDFVFTKDEYKEVSVNSPMFGVDCEMCKTKNGIAELTRITITNEEHEVVYETLVQPDNKITNYMTAFSGITKEMLENVTKKLEEVQNDVRNILPDDAILVGHSLNCDLDAMKMMHPYVIDTSIIYNRTGERHKKTKLQYLVKEFFNVMIQNNKKGHDSAEDSIYALKLAQLKLTKNLEFGDTLLTNRRRASEIYKNRSNEEISNMMEKELAGNMLHQFNKRNRNTTIINTSNIDYREQVKSRPENEDKEDDGLGMIKCFKMDNNKVAIQKTCEVALENALTLTHLVLPSSKLKESKLTKTLTKVDNWIGNIYETAAVHALVVVIFAGNPGDKSGVAMVKIKPVYN